MHRSICLAFLLSLHVSAQQATPAVETLPSGIARIEGKDVSSGIAYTRLFLATATANSSPTAAIDLSVPTLTVQCTQTPAGKFHFELFVNFGGVTDTAFYPPWHSSPGDLFPPNNEKTNLTMEFLGYTKVKPVKRQFENVQPFGQLRYNSPGGSSSNMEEIAYYFQYLRALPTLHITGPGKTATFLTAPLLAQIHKEPLCRASGL
jgi:hypothetical protein